MSLTNRQEAIVIGSLLGDGGMRCKRNALLEVNHSEAQKTYVDWKYQELRQIVGTPPKLRRSNGSRIAYRFTTLSRPELTPIYRAFYGTGTKAIPELRLSRLALAVWFMDDGCKTRNSVYLNTQQFCVEDQLRLAALLGAQHGLQATLNRDKLYYRLRIRVDSMPRLKAIIFDLVLPEMRYKLP